MATFNTVPDKSDGDPYTEAMWDDSIKTNINNMIVRPAASVRSTSAQTATNNVATTATYDTEDFDTDGMATLGTNADRLTVVTAGIFLTMISIVWANSMPQGSRELFVLVNGSQYAISSTETVGLSAETSQVDTRRRRDHYSLLLSLTATDYVGAQVQQITAGSRSFQAMLQMTWLGRLS